MMTELASEKLAVARYEVALDWVKDKEPQATVEFLLDALSVLHGRVSLREGVAMDDSGCRQRMTL